MSKSLNSSTSAKGFTSELVRRRTLTSSFFSDHSIIVLNFSSLTFILFGSVLLCRTTCYLRNEYTTFVYTRFITFVYPYEIGGVYESYFNMINYVYLLLTNLIMLRNQR